MWESALGCGDRRGKRYGGCGEGEIGSVKKCGGCKGEGGKVCWGVGEVRGKVYGGGVRKARGDGGVKKCGRSRGTVHGGECGKVVGCRDR